jgi:tRNA-dihydrouridine synthase
MSIEQSEHFAELIGMTTKLRSRYLNTLAGFRIYDRFKRLSASNIVGKRKAEANVKIFADYKYFFLPVQEAARCYFFIEIAKFFDTNKRQQSLTIEMVLDYAQKHVSSFTTEEFIKFHNERETFPEIFKSYKPLSLKDIKRIRARLLRNVKTIEKLKVYRDKYLAHDDIKKDKVTITVKEIRTLLKLIQDTIDLLYRRLEFASNSYVNYDKEPVDAIDRVIKGLQEYEKERMRQIKEKYGF